MDRGGILRGAVLAGTAVLLGACGPSEAETGDDSGTAATGTADGVDAAQDAPGDTAAADTGGAATDTTAADTAGATTDTPADTTGADTTAGSTAGESSGDTGDPPVIGFQGLCFDAAPDGAAAPPPLPAYTGGVCPPMVPGINYLNSGGHGRTLLAVQPSDLAPGEVLPVAVLWHWLGGSADDFLEIGDVQNAVDEYRFIALIPEEKGDLLFRWPFSVIDSDGRVQEEFVFFDDMLACAAATWSIEPNCITSVGVSAGALWTAQLASGRGQYLASAVSLSGGTGGLVRPWDGSPHKMPVFVLWGGPDDSCIAVNFQDASHDFEDGLSADGHAVVECVHNCGHGVPPFEQPDRAAAFAPMWNFFLDHPYWLEDGVTSWSEGMPENTPMWCGIGPGSATPRVGVCDAPGC